MTTPLTSPLATPPDRQYRIKSLCGQQEQLKTTGAELKEEETKMKQELARLEKELKSLRVRGHELRCQATAIYVNISRITGEVCPTQSLHISSSTFCMHKCAVC